MIITLPVVMGGAMFIGTLFTLVVIPSIKIVQNRTSSVNIVT
jgi:hypothetical protein